MVMLRQLQNCVKVTIVVWFNTENINRLIKTPIQHYLQQPKQIQTTVTIPQKIHNHCFFISVYQNCQQRGISAFIVNDILCIVLLSYL